MVRANATRDRKDSDGEWKPSSSLKKQARAMKRHATPLVTLADAKARLRTVCFDCIKSYLQAGPDAPRISTDQYSAAYCIVYTVCTQKPPHNCSQQMYDFAIEEAKKVATVFPPESEARSKWIRFIAQAFMYLNRFYVQRNGLPEMAESLERAMRAAA